MVAVRSKRRRLPSRRAGSSLNPFDARGRDLRHCRSRAGRDRIGGAGPARGQGHLNLQPDLPTQFNDLATDNTGLLRAGGFSGTTSSSGLYGTDGVIASFLANGSLQTAFSGDGYLTTSFGRYDAVRRVRLDAHRDVLALVLSGSQGDGIGPHSPVDTVLARYLPDGSPDQSFGNGGTIRIPHLLGSGLEIEQNGRILVSGWDSTDHRVVVLRYLADGLADPSFGTAGSVDLGGRERPWKPSPPVTMGESSWPGPRW
jgi:hypothetical protein